MKRISTHILDLTRGRPASDVPVRLEEMDSSGHWRLLASTRTDQDGRCPQLLAARNWNPACIVSASIRRVIFAA